MGADDACSDDTQVAGAVSTDTAVVPELAPTMAAPTELAWSAADSDDLQLPGSWRPVFRNALMVFTACVAIAGAVTAVDRHWFTDLRRAGATEVVVATSVVTVAPEAAATTEVAARPLPSVPAAEHLVTPTTSGPSADAKFLYGLQQAGLTITDLPKAIYSGHLICADMVTGRSSEAEARLVMSDTGMQHMNALFMVYAAVDAYCPEFIGR